MIRPTGRDAAIPSILDADQDQWYRFVALSEKYLYKPLTTLEREE